MLLTLVWPDWLELVFHVDPDGRNGAVEWAIVAAFALAAFVCLGLAHVLRHTRAGYAGAVAVGETLVGGGARGEPPAGHFAVHPDHLDRDH